VRRVRVRTGQAQDKTGTRMEQIRAGRGRISKDEEFEPRFRIDGGECGTWMVLEEGSLREEETSEGWGHLSFTLSFSMRLMPFLSSPYAMT
jgi:hypothetical protein